MTKANFNCSQADLYMICRMGWQSCEEQLPAFAAFKAKYTPVFIADRRAEIDAAEALPNFQTRDAISETFRIQSSELLKQCLSNWQKLKRYIADAWPENLQKPKLEAAGQKDYTRAAEENWDAARALLTAGMQFIDDNTAALTANDNMPSTFQGAFKTAKGDFETKHQEFLNSQESNAAKAEDKNIANNDIHAKVMAMFLDGQEIFKNNDAIKKQFVFEQVLLLVSGPGTAGFKGTVIDSVTGLPIEDVVFTLKGSDKTTTTDQDGRFSILQLAAQEWEVAVVKAGYQEKKFKQTVNVGTVSTIKIELIPV